MSTKSFTMENYEKKGKRRRALIIWALLIAAALAFVGFRLGWFGGQQALIAGDLFPGASDQALAGHLPDMSEEQIKQQMQQIADASKFSFKINAQPIFENGASAGTLRIENPHHNVYPFVVEIFLANTQEKIYDSGGVLPNHHIDSAKLDIALAKGHHDAYAEIYAYDPESGEYQGKSTVTLTIIVNN